MVVEKNLRVTIDFYKKQYLPFITRNKKTFIKAGCINNTSTGKKVFRSAILLKICYKFLFRQSKKT